MGLRWNKRLFESIPVIMLWNTSLSRSFGLGTALARIERNSIDRTLTYEAYDVSGKATSWTEGPAYSYQGQIAAVSKNTNLIPIPSETVKAFEDLLAENQRHPTASCGALDPKMIRSTANYYN